MKWRKLNEQLKSGMNNFFIWIQIRISVFFLLVLRSLLLYDYQVRELTLWPPAYKFKKKCDIRFEKVNQNFINFVFDIQQCTRTDRHAYKKKFHTYESSLIFIQNISSCLRDYLSEYLNRFFLPSCSSAQTFHLLLIMAASGLSRG